MADFVVVGGGIIGLAIAWELAGRDRTVTLLEKGSIGGEASWAGAGMIPPGNHKAARTPEERMAAFASHVWPDWSNRLHEETGIDDEYWTCGSLEVRFGGSPEELATEVGEWREQGVTVEPRRPEKLLKLLPWLSTEVSSAYFQPDHAQIRNPRHLQALIAGCRKRGVELCPDSPVVDFEVSGERIEAVRTLDRKVVGGEYIIAAGAWSAVLMQRLGLILPLKPIRGQMALLSTEISADPHAAPQVIVQIGPRYLVPRRDGRILVGSTQEDVGFHKQTTVTGIQELLQLATQIAPSLAGARLEKTWSGLRPQPAGTMPLLGRVDGWTNLTLATGHFRSGIHLSPITAVLIRQLLLGDRIALPDAIMPIALDHTEGQGV